jgi:hypoxanthine phosphoribosyltransferase
MKRIKIENKLFEISIKSKEIQIAISKISSTMNFQLKDKDVVFVCILNGAFMFASDLLKKIKFNSSITFIKLSSYKDANSSGEIKKLIGINEEIRNKTVVIIEDIIDTGITIESTVKQLYKYNPEEIKIATLLYKPSKYLKNIEINYIGFEIPDTFVVGFGLDYNGYGRNLKDIYSLIL